MKWISVKDRLPDAETPVLILFPHNNTIEIAELVWEYPSYEETFNAFQYWDSPTDDGKGWEWGDISHWMNLPEPPEKDDD